IAGNNTWNGLKSPNILRSKNIPPIAININEDFFSNFELIPITRPTIIKIIGTLNNQDGNKKPKSRLFNNKNTPNNIIIAPTVVEDLLLLGGNCGFGFVCVVFSISIYLLAQKQTPITYSNISIRCLR